MKKLLAELFIRKYIVKIRIIHKEMDYMSEKYCPQTDIGDWITATGIVRDELQSQIDKKTEEDLEVLSAWADGDEEQLAAELVDSAIVSIGMLGLLGVDFNQAVQDKMITTWEKYDPDQVGAYVALGMTREAAFAHMKALWDQQHNPVLQLGEEDQES